MDVEIIQPVLETGVIPAAVSDPAQAARMATNLIGPRFGSVTLAALGTGATDATRLTAVRTACRGRWPVIQQPGTWYDGATAYRVLDEQDAGLDQVGSITTNPRRVCIEVNGDSMSTGLGGSPNSADDAAAYREYMQIELRKMGIYFEMRGNTPYSVTGRNSMMLDARTSSHGGAAYGAGGTGVTIDAQAVATQAISTRLADCHLVMGGYRDYALGRTVAQVQALVTTFVTNRLAANPDAWIFLFTSPKVLPPQAGAAALNVLITAHNAMLRPLAATFGGRVVCVEAGTALTDLHTKSSDGVQLNGEGCRALGEIAADTIAHYLRPSRSTAWPRKCTRHTAVPGVSFTANTDSIIIPAGVGLTDMGAGSFSMGIAYYANAAIPAGTYIRLLGTSAAHYYQSAVIYIDNLGVLNAIIGETPGVSGTNLKAGSGAVVANKWHFTVLACDAGSQICTLYHARYGADGTPCTLLGNQGYAVSPFVVHGGDALGIGAEALDLAWKGLVAVYHHAFVAKGHCMTAEEFEDLAWDLKFPASTTGYYPLTEGAAADLAPPPGWDTANGGPLSHGTLSGGAWSAAGAIATPWDFGGDS